MDTVRVARRLRDRGLARKQSDAIAEVLGDELARRAITDVKLNARLRTLESRLVGRICRLETLVSNAGASGSAPRSRLDDAVTNAIVWLVGIASSSPSFSSERSA